MVKAIAIDIDDTLSATNESFYKALDKNIKQYGYEDYFMNHYRHSEVMQEAFVSAEPHEGAIDFINYLKGKKYQVTILTARPLKYQEMTQTWIDQQGIKCYKVAHDGDKIIYCKKNGIGCLIDDLPITCTNAVENGIGAYMPMFDGKIQIPE